MSFGKQALPLQNLTNTSQVLDSKYLDQVFGIGGNLEAALPGYVFRAGQYGMAQQVDHTFALGLGTTLLAEGPPGTGKSLAYLIPLIKHARQHGTRGLVVTANIALQEQLMHTDLPLIQRCLPIDFKYALYKGRQNYLCKHRLTKSLIEMKKRAEASRAGHARPKDFFTEDEKGQESQILTWAKNTRTGDKSELSYEPTSRVWSKYSSAYGDCLGKKCEQGCWAAAARVPLNTASIIVTNYWVYFTHLQHGPIIPPYDYLVLDEAHKLVDIGRDFYGSEISRAAIKLALRDVDHCDEAEAAMDEANKFFSELERFRKSFDYRSRLRKELPIDHVPLMNALFGMKPAFDECIKLVEFEKRLKTEKASASELIADYEKQQERCIELGALLDGMATLRNHQHEVYYIEEPTKKGYYPKLCSKPVDISQMLRNQVFSTATVATSATLRDDASFHYISADMGAPNNAVTYVAPSPFNWQQQAALIIEKSMPSLKEVTREVYDKAVMLKVARTIMLAKGRTLALFTSRRMMHKAFRYADNCNLGYRLMVQDEMPRIRLLEEFRSDIKSCLFGTESFWAGVDVPGESLSCVVIDKLPFKSPDDPIQSFYDDQFGREAFNAFSVPSAIIQFRQGVGRLIRTVSDRGVVVVLDPRVASKSGYSRRFLDSLPDMSTLYDIEKIPEILG